jgi:hypothetical protein
MTDDTTNADDESELEIEDAETGATPAGSAAGDGEDGSEPDGDWGRNANERGTGDARDRGGRDRESESRGGRRRATWSESGLYERLQWVALIVLVLVAVATLFAFYTNVSRFISIWATRKYEPAIQAAFALAVLASSLAGIAMLSRNLR